MGITHTKAPLYVASWINTGRLLQRWGLNRLSALEPATPDNRYEHEAPGDLLHLDIKKLGRFERPGHRVTGDRRQDSPGAGWEQGSTPLQKRETPPKLSNKPNISNCFLKFSLKNFAHAL